jgi:hypothetical protein
MVFCCLLVVPVSAQSPEISSSLLPQYLSPVNHPGIGKRKNPKEFGPPDRALPCSLQLFSHFEKNFSSFLDILSRREFHPQKSP